MDFTEHHKPPRLPNYDYAAPGYYFVTFNTRLRNRDILCSIVGTACDDCVGTAALGGPSPVWVQLTPAGKIVDELIQNIDHVYFDVRVDCYVIMPDPVHLILALGSWENQEGPLPSAAPTALSKVINALKGLSAKRAGFPIWQDEYYDHILRNEQDLSDTRRYIEENPIKKEEAP